MNFGQDGFEFYYQYWKQEALKKPRLPTKFKAIAQSDIERDINKYNRQKKGPTLL